MHIISNSHSLFDEKLVSSLTDCELPFSLIEGNTNSAVISFIWEQYSHFSSLVSNLPDFDIGESDYKNELFDVLMKSIDLFKFDFDD